ncbi:MAG: MotA/TolQ/ExbB proton channel family protein [Alphaproteobacteria bacterium]|uniref:MotA/TolQ/ExbB proton channel family protein n=1 Tax=Candidatus Nitrobium versatile TaxID=2884831 RepID=A0A953JFY9_9BACT|nr:MotA/TolQ/ExbB proton channel family protein [Candidatus Nitrobium versatile]
MIELFQKGGPLMYPLLLCSILALAFMLERAYHYLRSADRKELLPEILALLRKCDYEGAIRLCESVSGPVAAVLSEALKHRGRSIATMEEAISLKGSQELKKLNKNLHILELVGRIAPLLGLLGTVLGMVEAFRTISSLKGSVDPSLLAGGIWEALITTVAGLCVAIPALVAHHLFEDRVKTVAFNMKHSGAEVVALLGERK